MPATARNSSCSPTRAVSYDRRRSRRCRFPADDAGPRTTESSHMTPAATSNPSAVTVEGLTKRYGNRVVVDDLSVAIPAGVVAGFVGPNGAGKTTTMAMLLGLVRPTSGSGTVLGHPLDRPARFLPRVGALIEGPALWPGLTATENLLLLARLGGAEPGR